jgi:hypothetical protein
MKPTAVSLFALAVSLYAADFWQSKPFTEWSEKDSQKIMESSPWAKSVSVAIGGGMIDNQRSPGRGRGTTMDTSSNIEDPMAGPGGAGMGGGRNRGGGGDAGGGPVAPPSMIVVVRWESALPVTHAKLKMKYGSEVSTSDEAKKALDAGEMKFYVIAVAGAARSVARGQPEEIKKALMEQTTLSAKGKEELKPVDIQRSQRGGDLLFIFPKKTEFSVEDKEVEFATRFESVSIKQKFKLKDMVYNGKLAL